MRIGIDCRMYNESGIGRYIRNLLIQLQRLDKDNQYFIFHLKDDYDTLLYYNNFHKVLTDLRWYGISEQVKLPKIIEKLELDLVHFPHFNAPIFYRGKFVVTIHDLIHQHFSMERSTAHGPIVYKFKKFGYRQVFQHAIKKSLKILVPSDFVKEQLIKEWGVEKGKIMVTSEAVDDKIFTIVGKMSNSKNEIVMKKFKINPPYIFYIGNAHPHKNVEGLIRVFGEIREKYPDLSLVLAGFDHYFWQRIKRENQEAGIIYTGYVSDEDLVVLYKNALCFVMPSLEEGFGIPLLEAMACSCPVVSSGKGALREVGGDAAIYFDPKSNEDMVDKISQVLISGELRKKLIEKGKQRVKLFSWEKLAKQTLEVYQQCE